MPIILVTWEDEIRRIMVWEGKKGEGRGGKQYEGLGTEI
jgi:hypothetical protein